jgi:hypothetical protein
LALIFAVFFKRFLAACPGRPTLLTLGELSPLVFMGDRFNVELWRSKSAHVLNDDHFHSDGESMKRLSSQLQVKPGSSYDDTMLHVNRTHHSNIPSQLNPLQHTSNQAIPHSQTIADNPAVSQIPITESQSSSPSASKDSGISSMNGVYKPPVKGLHELYFHIVYI